MTHRPLLAFHPAPDALADFSVPWKGNEYQLTKNIGQLLPEECVIEDNVIYIPHERVLSKVSVNEEEDRHVNLLSG